MVLTKEEKAKRRSEKGILNLLKSLDIECYANKNPKQIPLSKIYKKASKKQSTDIDIIGREGTVGFLVEVTELKDHPTNKIKKFISNSNIFLSGDVTWDEKIKFFKDLPETRKDDFEEIKVWKKIYFGTTEKLLNDRITKLDFPQEPELYIFNSDDIEYLKSLSKVLGKFAKYQFLSSLGFTPKSLGRKSSIIREEFTKIDNRFVTGSNSQKADIYLIEFTPRELLETGRVYRYGDLTIPFEDSSSKNERYQRILIKSKIENIAKKFLADDKRVTYPNTITVVLSDGCKIVEGQLIIPNHYASIDIIDGQHRVFAYAHNTISDKTRDESKILATAIKFKTNDRKIINNSAAKLFWGINSSQTIVKNNLLFLIKYSALGDRDPIAISGEIIRRVNDGNSELWNVFNTQPLRRKNKFGNAPIPIATIVPEFADMVDIIKYRNNMKHILGKKSKEYEKNSEILVNDGQKKLENYFYKIKETFPRDWNQKSKSNLLSSNYIAAFIKLLKYYKIEKKYTDKKIESTLMNLKSKINSKEDIVIFKMGDKNIPDKRAGVTNIFEFLKKNST